MATNERLFHNWVPFMSEGYMCDKCGALAFDWEHVDRISMNPCVDDDDPCIAHHQEIMNTELAVMWKKVRADEIPEGFNQSKSESSVWTLEDKIRFDIWLNGSDPIMDLDWTDDSETSSNEDKHEGDAT